MLVIQGDLARLAPEIWFMRLLMILGIGAALGFCGCNKNENSVPGAAGKPVPVTSRLKIKIGPNGEIFANNKELSQEEFLQELQRLKQSNGGIVYTRDNPAADTTAAQTAVVAAIEQLGIPLEYSRQ
ncbi:MAG: hypothetical protein FJ398_08945 [Verrucomicrobia bacterium]|nr:hypothetical protein [Verrucomicrobiota bacterium]